MKKRFLYLIQGKGKLGINLQGIESEDSDYISLTWKKPVKGSIYYPYSTWTNGRNRLFIEAINKDYLYYIFLDEDIILMNANKSNNENPWRIFEKQLLEYEPAVGFPHINWFQPKEYKIKGKVECVYSFDACINAIHKEALNVLLPYFNNDDKLSWWNSQDYFHHISSILYKNHIIKFNELLVDNPNHSVYPQDFSLRYNVDLKIRESILIKRKIISSNGYERFGSPKKKKKSYIISPEKLKKIFDYNKEPFVKRDKIIKDMNKTNISSIGEFFNRELGSFLTKIIFLPIYIFYELKKRINRQISVK